MINYQRGKLIWDDSTIKTGDLTNNQLDFTFVENGITIWIMIPNILLHIIPYIINQPSFISTKISPIPWWTSRNSLTINHQPGIRPTSLPGPVPALEVGPSCGPPRRPRPRRGVGSPRWPRRGSVDLGGVSSGLGKPTGGHGFWPWKYRV